MFKGKQITKKALEQIDELVYNYVLDIKTKSNLVKGRITEDVIMMIVNNVPEEKKE